MTVQSNMHMCPHKGGAAWNRTRQGLASVRFHTTGMATGEGADSHRRV